MKRRDDRRTMIVIFGHIADDKRRQRTLRTDSRVVSTIHIDDIEAESPDIMGIDITTRDEFPTDWLYFRFGQRRKAAALLVRLSNMLPCRWDDRQEKRYRRRVETLLWDIFDTSERHSLEYGVFAFRAKFTNADVVRIKEFIVYLLYAFYPDEFDLIGVEWSYDKSTPIIPDIDAAFSLSERIASGLMERLLCDIKVDLQ